MKKNIVIVVLLVLVLGLGGYLVFDKLEVGTNKSEIEKVEKKKTEKVSIKIDKDKDYIYDADYKYNNRYNVAEYENDLGPVEPLNFTTAVNFKDLRVPYININTEESKNINSNLEKLYLEYAKTFDESMNNYKNDKNDMTKIIRTILDYKVYYTENTVSVVIGYGTQSTSLYHLSYLGYTFDLKTGALLTVDDIAKTQNLTTDNLLIKSKTSLEKYLQGKADIENKYLEDDYAYIKNNMVLHGKIELNSGVYSGVIYFVDSSNQINLLTTTKIDAGIGFNNVLFTLK